MLGGCAYVVDTSIQDVRIETPGAHNAICYMYVDGLRYKVHPPEAINISKNEKDLIIDCRAPGNRRQMVKVPAQISRAAAGNVVTGVVPGAAFDYASGALFKYPDVISIDFTGIAPSAMPLPAHNSPDIKQPEEYRLEEFLPSSPRLNKDIGKEVGEVQRRQTQSAPLYKDSFISEGSDVGGKSNPQPAYQLPTKSGASQPSATGAPAPLYAGE